MLEPRSLVWRRAGTTALALIAGILPVPVVFLMAMGDPPPGLANPGLHLGLRVVFVLWLYVTIPAIFGFVSPGRRWEWGAWIAFPLLAFMAIQSVLRNLLPDNVLSGRQSLLAWASIFAALVIVLAIADSRTPAARRGRWALWPGIVSVAIVIVLWLLEDRGMLFSKVETSAYRYELAILMRVRSLASLLGALFAVFVVSTAASHVGSLLGQQRAARPARLVILVIVLLGVLVGVGALLFRQF